MSRKSGPKADPVAKSDITRSRNALVARILEGHGTAPHAERRAAFDNAGFAEPLSTLIDEIAEHTYKVTDEDMAGRSWTHSSKSHRRMPC